MDWPESTQPILAVLPRGMQREGGLIGGDVVVLDNPARWTSKYGSIVTLLYGIAQADGLNEKGLGAHLLYLRATDRFQRAAYFMGVLPEPKGEREAVASVLAIVRNCSVPFGAPYGEFGIYNTEYRTVMNLTSRRYYFELTTSPNLVWADLDRFDLEPGAPVMALDPDSFELSGNVSGKFAQAPAPF